MYRVRDVVFACGPDLNGGTSTAFLHIEVCSFDLF